MKAPTITTERLVLKPLRVEDAAEMVAVLADDAIYEFIGGKPPSLEELRIRYSRLVAGPEDLSEVWLNWIVRLRPSEDAIGTVQAGLRSSPQPIEADIAWVIGVPFQERGLASEAASALVNWLRSAGVATIRAAIHPDHLASTAVARKVGLRPTSDTRDGEILWESPAG